MYLALLGRQSEISLAEIERVFDFKNMLNYSNEACLIQTNNFNLDKLGSIPKAGRVVKIIKNAKLSDLNQFLVENYVSKWKGVDYKITLGISCYGFPIKPRDIQKIGVQIKSNLKKQGVSLRLVPNVDSILNTATSHHNKLGLSENKQEILIAKIKNDFVIAESIGAQNITAYAKRDQARPNRDAFVGMLPPKLAQIMINLALGDDTKVKTVLDPFCGTGVILQEAALMGHEVYGTDLSEKMIRYSRDNLNWLSDIKHIKINWYMHEGDATKIRWRQPIDTVVCETYLGQPFSTPPSQEKLSEVKLNCNHIVTSFLKNIHSQIDEKTALCIAVPAWCDNRGNFTHLPLISNIEKLGFIKYEFKSLKDRNLLYFRPNQVVAREIIVLHKK